MRSITDETGTGPLVVSIAKTVDDDASKAASFKIGVVEPFHRLYADGLLDRHSPATNEKLFFMGERYQHDWEKADKTLIQSPNYGKPMVSGGAYDAYRDTPLAERRVDKSRDYYEAAQSLDKLGLRTLVEDIILYRRKTSDAGREYSGCRQEQQARSAAITGLVIGLRILHNHYLKQNIIVKNPAERAA